MIMNKTKIKNNTKDFLPRYFAKEIELIKNKLGLNPNAEFYYLGCKWQQDYLLCDNTVYIVNWNWSELKANRDNFDDDKVELIELYSAKLLKDNPQIKDDIEFKTIIKGKTKYDVTRFIIWLNEPCDLTESVDLAFYEIIKYLNQYKIEDLKSNSYIYYAKKDNDFCYCTNIYAKNIKTGKELKLYIPNKIIEIESKKWIQSEPLEYKDFFVEGNVTEYEKHKCKRDFLDFVKTYNNQLQVNNFFVLELLKQVIHPIEIFSEWSCHRIFCNPSKYTNIWVEDFPDTDKEPSFFITDKPYLWGTSKVTTLNFKTPTYHDKGIYKRGIVKYSYWNLNEEEIKDYMDFLASPPINEIPRKSLEKYIKTNWQLLIFEYNHNTAGWGWGEKGFDAPLTDYIGNIKPLPFDLPMPDYKQLLKDKYVQ